MKALELRKESWKIILKRKGLSNNDFFPLRVQGTKTLGLDKWRNICNLVAVGWLISSCHQEFPKLTKITQLKTLADNLATQTAGKTSEDGGKHGGPTRSGYTPGKTVAAWGLHDTWAGARVRGEGWGLSSRQNWGSHHPQRRAPAFCVQFSLKVHASYAERCTEQLPRQLKLSKEFSHVRARVFSWDPGRTVP